MDSKRASEISAAVKSYLNDPQKNRDKLYLLAVWVDDNGACIPIESLNLEQMIRAFLDLGEHVAAQSRENRLDAYSQFGSHQFAVRIIDLLKSKYSVGQNRLNDNGIWVTSDKKFMPISVMSDDHLLRLYKILLLEAKRHAKALGNPEDWYGWLDSKRFYPHLENELKKRKLGFVEPPKTKDKQLSRANRYQEIREAIQTYLADPKRNKTNLYLHGIWINNEGAFFPIENMRDAHLISTCRTLIENTKTFTSGTSQDWEKVLNNHPIWDLLMDEVERRKLKVENEDFLRLVKTRESKLRLREKRYTESIRSANELGSLMDISDLDMWSDEDLEWHFSPSEIAEIRGYNYDSESGMMWEDED